MAIPLPILGRGWAVASIGRPTARGWVKVVYVVGGRERPITFYWSTIDPGRLAMVGDTLAREHRAQEEWQ